MRIRADTTGDEIRRCATGLLTQSRSRMERALASSVVERDKTVHRVRVDMKRLRALWYLVQPGLTSSVCKRLHEQTRALAGSLSGQRDYAVMLDTLASLKSGIAADEYHQIERVIERALKPAADPGRPLIMALHHLDDLQAGVMLVDWASVRRLHIEQGLKRTGLKSETLKRSALQCSDREALHRWRKWCKLWLYQLLWLVPEARWRWMQQLKPLGSALGRVHDLDVLQTLLADVPESQGAVLQQAWSRQRRKALWQVEGSSRKVYARPARVRCRMACNSWLKY